MLNIKLPFSSGASVLATGAELKNSFAVLDGDTAFISGVFGDLKDPKTLRKFEKAVTEKERAFKGGFRTIACDLHPEYASTKYAKEIFEKKKSSGKKVRISEIQHHHAHIAACMAENGLRGRVIGVAFDGTGYGPDGNIWGGEFLAADYRRFERAAHLEYVPMPGADKAVLEPARMAFSYLYKTYKGNTAKLELDVLKRIGRHKYRFFAEMIDKNVNSPLTSSAGRLFDAVSSLIGIRDYISYEGEAAVELERIAAGGCSDIYKFELNTCQGRTIVSFRPMIKAMVRDLRRKKPPDLISRKFHNTLGEAIKMVCSIVRKKTGLNKVVLSGGVFQNRVLSDETEKRLKKGRFSVYTHSRMSCADSSLSLGQAVIATYKAKRSS